MSTICEFLHITELLSRYFGLRLNESEILFYGGFFFMGLSVLTGAAMTLLFSVTGRRLKKRLEAEFGKRRR